MRLIKPLESLPNMRRASKIATVIAGLAIMLSTIGDLHLTGRAEATPICQSSGIPIWITIEKVRSSNGTIKVELYSGEAEKVPDKKNKVDRKRIQALQGETKLCLNAPSEGNYSISLYHDENDNKKLDRNFIGIPREGFGFSNNPPLRLGMPEQIEMRFTVEHMAVNLRISVIYL